MSNQKDKGSDAGVDMKEFVKQAVNNSPYYRHIRMELAGFEDDGRSRVELRAGPEHMNIWNTAHGGVLASLLDSACGLATVPLREGDERTVTMEMHIKYFAPVREGLVRAYGRVVHKGRGTIATEAEAFDEAGNLLGKAYTTHRVRKPRDKGGKDDD
jgi:uncharacterized protein (TIGR00369 family)